MALLLLTSSRPISFLHLNQLNSPPADKILTSGSTTRQRTDTPKRTDRRPGLIQDLHAKLREATSHTSKLPTSVFKTLASRLSA